MASSIDKYANFGDNTMRDRVAFAHAHETPPREAGIDEDPSLQKSGFTSTGWDKYYFFSNPANCSGPGNGNLHPTARQGRDRPAMTGPQTFTIEAFTPEELARARVKIEKKGTRTTYKDSFSQIQRSSSVVGPLEPLNGPDILHKAKTTGASVSDTLTQHGLGKMNRSLSATEILAGPLTAQRCGPHWPPHDGTTRPDPIRTREALMRGPHRTIVDLHATDRKAPGAVSYTMTRY